MDLSLLNPFLEITARTRVQTGALYEAKFDIEVRAGTTSFYQYDFATGALANSFFIGTSIKPRDPAMALVNLKNLTAASSRPGPDSNSTSHYGRLDETNTVSAVSGRRLTRISVRLRNGSSPAGP